MKHVERQTKTLNSSTCTIIGRHDVYAPLRLFFHYKPGHNTKALRNKENYYCCSISFSSFHRLRPNFGPPFQSEIDPCRPPQLFFPHHTHMWR